MKGIEILEMGQQEGRLYVKKPLPVMAKQMNQTFWVKSLEGNHQGKEGDYLVRGVKGELYICDREIFEETYKLLNP